MQPGASTVGDWSSRVRGTTAEEFAVAHPHPFLVQERHAPEPMSAAEELQFATVASDLHELSMDELLGPASLAALAAFAVVKRDGSGFSGMVNVGRAENCDLVLPAPSVSKFHAFFTSDPVSGRPQVVDGGSTNGTSVNGRRLEPHERTDLAPRDLVAFGADAVFRFHSPETFHELVALAG